MMYIDGNKERCIILATYMIENKATVRSVATRFGISKSTVHKDLTHILRDVNMVMYSEVQEILQTNKKERHLRGGEATKNKYKKQQ